MGTPKTETKSTKKTKKGKKNTKKDNNENDNDNKDNQNNDSNKENISDFEEINQDLEKTRNAMMEALEDDWGSVNRSKNFRYRVDDDNHCDLGLDLIENGEKEDDSRKKKGKRGKK